MVVAPNSTASLANNPHRKTLSSFGIFGFLPLQLNPRALSDFSVFRPNEGAVMAQVRGEVKDIFQ